MLIELRMKAIGGRIGANCKILLKNKTKNISFGKSRNTDSFMLYDEFNNYKPNFFKDKALEKADILKNLNPAFLAREYQKEALGRFYYYCEEYPGNKTPMHLLFNMATGAGKTLIMAANILYLYKQGYRNFIFFTHINNIAIALFVKIQNISGHNQR